jgi:hypothetical protein
VNPLIVIVIEVEVKVPDTLTLCEVGLEHDPLVIPTKETHERLLSTVNELASTMINEEGVARVDDGVKVISRLELSPYTRLENVPEIEENIDAVSVC